MDNVLNKIICILSCIIIILTIFIGSFFVTPSFGLSITDFELLYSTGLQYPSNSYYEGYSYMKNSRNNYKAAYKANEDYPIYLFLVPSSYKVYIVIDDSYDFPTDNYICYVNRNSSSGNTLYTDFINSYNDKYKYIEGTFSDSYYGYTDLYAPSYESFESGMSALIETVAPSYDPLYNNFNIPRGYLAWIEWNFIPESLELSTTFPNNSDFWNSGYPFNTQWVEYYHGSSVITIPTVLSNGGTKIPWVKGGNSNIWGQSKEASANLTSITGSVDSPSFICNPVYQSGSNRLSSLFNSNELPPMNGSITIHDPEGAIKKIRLYSLTAAYNSETDSIDNTLSYDTPSYSVDVDENGVVSYQPLNTTAPAVSSPVENGGTYVDPTEYSTSDIISTINNAFSNLISKIEAIFHPAAGYFQSLLNSFNDFVHWLSNLWVWLPAPIVTLIEAVLYISISVGLIKLVLK